MSINRRSFLQQASVGIGVLAGSQFAFSGWARADDPLRSADQASLYDEAALRALAARVLEAARSAGAQFADVRLNTTVMRLIDANGGKININRAQWQATFGVRAVVGGSWGFAGGTVRTADEVARVARLAVARARAMHRANSGSFVYAPAPVASDGRWSSPMQIDPFTVPAGEIEQVFLDAMAEVGKVKGINFVAGGSKWQRSDRLFASTEGSTIVQRMYESFPGAYAVASPPPGMAPQSQSFELDISAGVDGFAPGQYGYEQFASVDLKTEWRRAAEEAARLAALPRKTLEVGRYEVVLGPKVVALLLVALARALELDRALGDKERTSGATSNPPGTSFAAPPLDILGQYRMASPLVTITADRSRPHAGGTIGWDEEGVQPEEFTLVKEGIVMDYITTRTSAPALAPWYAKQGKSVRSHGCTTRTGALPPISQIPNLTLQPGAGTTSLEDLIEQVRRGFYMEEPSGILYGLGDRQQLSIHLPCTHVYEIVNGRRGRLLRGGVGLELTTPQLWRSVVALGGAQTASLQACTVDPILPDYCTEVGVQAVPMLVKQVNVVNTSRNV